MRRRVGALGLTNSEHAAKVIGEALINLRKHGGVVAEH